MNLYRAPKAEKHDDAEGNTLMWQLKDKKVEPSDEELGIDEEHKSHLLL